MYRRIFIILLLILNILVLSGCWDRVEPEDLGIVSGIGIEEGSAGKVRIVIQTLNTSALVKSAGGKGVEFEKAYRNSVIEGDTVLDAFNKFTTITSTRRNLSHCSLFVISEDLARDRGVKDILDFFERDPQSRLDAWIIVGDGSLVNLFDIPGRISTSPSQRMSDELKFQNEAFAFAPLKLEDFIRTMESETSQPYTALVSAEPNLSYSTNAGHGILDGSVPEPVENISIDNTAVFKQDKMVGLLNREESRGLLWLKGDVHGGIITFPVPGKDDKKAVTSILRVKSELKPEIINGQIYITAKILVKSFLNDDEAGIKLDNPEEVKITEDAQSEQIKREVEAALQKAQQDYDVDIFGFGEALHRSYPEEWRKMKSDWEELFPDVRVDIQVDSLIEHTSRTGNAAESGQSRQ